MTGPHLARYQLPLLVWILAIFALSAIPGIPEIRFPISPDKLAHIGIYFVLCMLSRRAFFHQDRFLRVKKHSLSVAFGFTVVYGALDEFHQLYVPGRWADIYDVLADAVGGALFTGWFVWKARRSNSPQERERAVKERAKTDLT
ncbi:MAG: VanZ family protein [Ignavibacteriales bacterium]|nr:VanZ family protein [Ignavibacteriales bacterium]